MIPPQSATQIDTAKDCLRKWAFRYLTDLPKPEPGSGALLGQKIHAVAEAYLSKGTQPDRDIPEGEIFIGGLPFLPPPGSGGVEGRISIEISGILFTGFIDLRTRGSMLPQWPYGSVPVVLDHKTSSDPKKYGLTTETLKTNIQTLIYGFYEMSVTKRDEIGFRWLYYKTKGRKLVYPVDVLMPRRQITDNFEKYVWSTAEKLHTLYEEKPDPNTLEPCTESCSKYGGCPYQGVCILTPAQKASGLMRLAQNKEEEMTSLRAKLEEQANRGNVNPPLPGVVQPTPGSFQQPPLPGPAQTVPVQQTQANFPPPPPGGFQQPSQPLPVQQSFPVPPPREDLRRQLDAELKNTAQPVVQTMQSVGEKPPQIQGVTGVVFTDMGLELDFRGRIAAALLTRHDYTPSQLRKEADKYVEALLK